MAASGSSETASAATISASRTVATRILRPATRLALTCNLEAGASVRRGGAKSLSRKWGLGGLNSARSYCAFSTSNQLQRLLSTVASLSNTRHMLIQTSWGPKTSLTDFAQPVPIPDFRSPGNFCAAEQRGVGRPTRGSSASKNEPVLAGALSLRSCPQPRLGEFRCASI